MIELVHVGNVDRAFDERGLGARQDREGVIPLGDFYGGRLLDGLGMSTVNVYGAIIDDVVRLVIANGRIHVLLTVQRDAFLALGVIKDHAVVTAALRRAVGLEAADHFLLGQIARRHLVGVVDAAND